MNKVLEKDPSFESHCLLLMDSLKQHLTDYIEDEAWSHMIELLPLPPHSSGQTQPLDLVIFASTKSIMPRMKVDKHLSAQSKEVDRVSSEVHPSYTAHNIRKAFQRAGIISSFDNERQLLLPCVDTRFCDKVRHFTPQEILEKDSVFENERTRIPLNSSFAIDSEPIALKRRFEVELCLDHAPMSIKFLMITPV